MDRRCGSDRFSRWILLGVLAALPLAACERPDRGGSRAARPAEPSAEDSITRGGTIVIAAPSDLDFANSLVSADDRTKEILIYALFLPLLRYDENLEYEGRLAESWQMEGDTAVLFRLRRDVRWHDGVPTTAEDVAFTIRAAQDPATGFPNGEFFAKWTDVEVIDSFTVRVRMMPHLDPLAGVPFTAIMPRHLLDTIPRDRMRQAGFNKRPVGNGPFRFTSYQANDRWVFDANPDFPRALGGSPYMDRVVWRIVPENAAQVIEIRTGNADVILSPRADEIRSLDADTALRAMVRPSPNYLFVGWNGKRPQFRDSRVRRALSMAIDREEILQALRSGYGQVAVGPVGPFHWAFDESIRPLPFDPTAARALLAEAGFSDRDRNGVIEDSAGTELRFALTIPPNNAYNADVAEMIRADLAAVGARMTTRPTEAATLFADVTSPERRFDAVLLGWVSDFRVNLRDVFHSSATDGPFQLASYSNPAVDSILDRAPTLTERSEARPLYRRLQEILKNEQPWTFLFYYPDLVVIRERVRNAQMDIRGIFVNLPEWWLAERSD